MILYYIQSSQQKPNPRLRVIRASNFTVHVQNQLHVQTELTWIYADGSRMAGTSQNQSIQRCRNLEQMNMLGTSVGNMPLSHCVSAVSSSSLSSMLSSTATTCFQNWRGSTLMAAQKQHAGGSLHHSMVVISSRLSCGTLHLSCGSLHLSSVVISSRAVGRCDVVLCRRRIFSRCWVVVIRRSLVTGSLFTLQSSTVFC